MDSLKLILLHILSVIIEDAEELGCKVDIYNVEPNCWLLANKGIKKTVAVGLVPDLNRKRKKRVGAMEIKVNKLNWASAEGFTFDDMIEKDLDVFHKVRLSDVAKILANK